MSGHEKCGKCDDTYQLSCYLRDFIVLEKSYVEYRRDRYSENVHSIVKSVFSLYRESAYRTA